MGIFAYLCIGLFVGAIFQRIQRTKQPRPSGLMSTTFLGAAGATMAGVVWDVLLEQDSTLFISGSSLVVATIGACTTFGVLRTIRRG